MKVKISSTGQIGKVEAKDLKSGQEILVNSENIIEPAFVLCDKNCPREDGEAKTVDFVRIFSDEDLLTKKERKKEAESYLEEARAKAFRHGLDMKILDADLSFDQKKLTFYFSSEGRIDFRSLVSDMVGDFGKIIRLQQIGARDETKHFGGFGKCGRPLCCATFLNNLDNVTLDMAEVQEISTSKSSKLAGCCGKLMCCLSYEADLYKDEKNKMPKIGSKMKNGSVEGEVVGHNIFEGKVVLKMPDGKKVEVEQPKGEK